MDFGMVTLTPSALSGDGVDNAADPYNRCLRFTVTTNVNGFGLRPFISSTGLGLLKVRDIGGGATGLGSLETFG